MKRKTTERFLEFLIIGVIMGTVEDLIAVKLATGAMIKPQTIVIIFLVSIPFAAFSELVVDHPENKIMNQTANKLHSNIPFLSSK